MRTMRKCGNFYSIKVETTAQRSYQIEADTRAEAEHIALADEAITRDEKITKKEITFIQEV